MEMLDKTLLSEEILQEILDLTIHGLNPQGVHLDENNVKFYFITDEDGEKDWRSINIYELMHLAKELIYNQKYDFEVGKSLLYKQWAYILSDDFANTCIAGKVDTEIEAVFRSLKWIIDNK